MNKRLPDPQGNIKQEDPFTTDPSQSSLPTLQNNISKNNLVHISNNMSVQNAFTQDNEESNILVAIRVRPMITKETSIGEYNIIRAEDNLIIVLDPIEIESESTNRPMDVLHRSKEQRYAFDKIFTKESQEQIYNETCRSLIRPVLNGYNACVFAYGATGAGKTYTMLGYQDVPGIMVLTIRDMFDTIKNVRDKEYNITISYVEIYNETIRDLLVPSSSYLELRDDPIKGVTIAGVTEHKAESTEQIMNLLFLGNKRRTTEATNANQTSSRSHAVFQIVVQTSPRTKNTSVETLTGKLSLIDLAGSERGTVTENRGIRLREGAKINRSLLALANCINALGDKSKKGFFVNYRDSKLTRLLKDSLGGNCKTVMIANISPAGNQIEETINTLKYANRAKNIKTKVMSNKKMVSLHIAEYKNIISDLRQEIEELKSKLHDPKEINNPPFQPMANNFMKGNHEPAKDTERENKDCPCWCGRAEDDIDMKKIQEEIFENFQQRIQLRRSLMELEEQNAMNILEMRKRKAEIMVWEKNENASSQSHLEGVTTVEDVSSDNPEKRKRPLSALPKEVQANYKNIQTLRASTDRNAMTRDALNYQLQENIDEAKKIRDAIPKKIRHQDKREYLEVIIKNHVLELQNIELEIHLKIQEKIIEDLKNIVQGQRKIISDNKLEEQIHMPWDEEQVLSDCEENGDDDPGEEIDLDDFVYDDNQGDDKDKDSSDSFENMDNKHGGSHTTSPEKKKKEKKSPSDEEKKYDGRMDNRSVPLSDRGPDNQKNQIHSQGELMLPKEYDDVANQSTKLTPVNNSYSGNSKDNSTIQASRDKIKKPQQGSTNTRAEDAKRSGNKSVSPMPFPQNGIGKDGKFKANLAALNIYGAGQKTKDSKLVKNPGKT